jgi:nuclear transport factor 2 (NTF2) superfamily protein
MAPIDEMIRSYVASWNESDPAKRNLTIETTWSPDGIYRNATTEFEGHDGIAQAVGAAHDAFVSNGFVFTLANVDTNHDAVRYRWEMLPAGGGEPDSIGTHGRLVSDHQFIDKAPSAV